MASWLCDLLGAGFRGPTHSAATPAATPKHLASEEERWMEQEVAHLQQEAWRLRDVNDHLRNELSFLQTSPRRSNVEVSAYFDKLPKVQDAAPSEDDDSSEDEGPPEVRRSSRAQSMTEAGGAVGGVLGRVRALSTAVETVLRGEPDEAKRDVKGLLSTVRGQVNTMVIKGSALTMTRPAQAVIYSIAAAFVIFVLVATSTHLGAVDHSHDHSEAHAACDPADVAHCEMEAHAHARRLGGGASPKMKHIAATLTGSGLGALIVVTVLKQPLLLGYIVGGILVGPLCLNIVESHESISDMSNLGLIFLLFMVGLELDLKSIFSKMDRITFCTGFVQLPMCAAVMYGIFKGLSNAGINFGAGLYGPLYCGITGALASTMIVSKLLETRADAEVMDGRLTSGILASQSIWAILLLILQPELDMPTAGGLFTSFGWLLALVVFALVYAKFVIPAALYCASKSVELMLVLALAWCFFICATAMLSFVNVPMELAALIAGIALATFPYSVEFIAKIKYIRDFFFALFFASLGMMLPAPSTSLIGAALMMSLVLVAVRWLGVCLPAAAFGASPCAAVIATLNLSQLGELALVLGALGCSYGHIEEDTLEIVTMTFILLSIFTAFLVPHNLEVYRWGARLASRLRGRSGEELEDDEQAQYDTEDRDIILLGFHKVAHMLLAEMHTKTPELLKSLRVVDFDKGVMAKLSLLGIKCTVGDISSPEVLSHSQRGEPRLVISTIPDTSLHGVSNQGILAMSKQIWPSAQVIVTADGPQQAQALYAGGAGYVLRFHKPPAERLHSLLTEHSQSTHEHDRLQEVIDDYRTGDDELRSAIKYLGKLF